MLRNPWGDFEWNGDWSDNSDLWTDDIKKQCGYNDDTGLFWMSYQDLCYYFSRIQICHVNDDYHYSFMKASQHVGSYSLMRLMVSGSGEHIISVSQTDERCFSRHSNYDYSNCRIIVLKVEKDGNSLEELEIKYIQGVSGWDRETHVMVENLDKGEYLIYVEMDWNQNTEDQEFCVTCYGASRTFFMRDEKTLFDKNELLRKVMASKCSQNLEGVTIIDFASQGAPEIKKYKCFGEEGYGFFHFVNESKSATLKEKVSFTTFKGLALCKPQQGSSYDISVGPGQSKTILIKCDPEGYAMSTSSSTSVSFTGKKLKEMCKELGKKASRPDPSTGQSHDISVYTYQHSSGVCYLYTNNSTAHILEEQIEFQLQGLEIEDNPS